MVDLPTALLGLGTNAPYIFVPGPKSVKIYCPPAVQVQDKTPPSQLASLVPNTNQITQNSPLMQGEPASH